MYQNKLFLMSLTFSASACAFIHAFNISARSNFLRVLILSEILKEILCLGNMLNLRGPKPGECSPHLDNCYIMNASQ